MNQARLSGKVAVVTGGTSGIGRASCERLIAEGARVVFCGRRVEQGLAIADALGSAARFVAADVEQEDQVRAVIDTAVKEFGRLDIVFNNAGSPSVTPTIADITSDEFDRTVRVLLRSVFYGLKHAASIMSAQGSGSIICNASVAAHVGGYASSHVYSACKAAIVQLARSVSLELAPSGVRVNTVSPGAIATGIFGRGAGLDAEHADQSAKLAEKLLRKAQPFPRAGLPQDVAAAVAFLASDDAEFITGRDLVIDGGAIAGRRFSDVLASQQAMHKALNDK